MAFTVEGLNRPNKRWETYVIECSVVSDMKFGSEAIAKLALEVFREWAICPVGSSTDTAADERKAFIKALGDLMMKEGTDMQPPEWFPCVLHLLDLIMGQFLKAAGRTFGDSRNCNNAWRTVPSFDSL